MTHPRSFVALALVVLCGACRQADPQRPTTTTPDAAPARIGLADLKVTVDGKPVVMTQAFIKTLPVDGRHQLFVTSRASSCRELQGNLFNRHEGETTLLLDIGQRLAPDGTLSTLVTDVYIRGSGTVEPGSRAAVDGKQISLDYVAHADEPKTIEVHGKLEAETCGAHVAPKDGEPKGQHPSSAFVTVAGKKLPIVSAIRTGKDRSLVLSTGPKDCSGTTPWAALILGRQWGRWTANGQWLGRELANGSMSDKDGQPETKELKVETGAAGSSEDGPTIALTLSGAGTIAEYPVSLEGTIEALDCPE